MDTNHRRSMLPPPSGAYSNLPMPSTLKKSTASTSMSRSRMSLAGPALRPQPPPPPSTNPRQSMARPPQNPLLMSVSKQNVGRTPLHQSVRRGSTWTGGAASAPAPQVIKDPRPLRDRQYQSKMRQDIIAYLQGTECEVTNARLVNITGKDYRDLWDYFIRLLDPNHIHLPKWEEDFIATMKANRYPYAHTLDPRWLAAPASMHSWPALLGTLHWLLEMCKMRDAYFESQHETLQDPACIPVEFDTDLDHAALAFNFYEEAYTVWLDMDDDLVEPKQNYEDRYAQRNASVQAEVEQQLKLLEETKMSLKKLQNSAPALAKLERDNGFLKGDSEKFQKILQQYESRKKKLTDAIAYEKAELQREDSHLDQMKLEHEKLLDVVRKQNLTPEEVNKMNTDHETLSRNLQELKQKIADTQKTIMNLEVSVTNRVAAAEEALDLYTNLLSSLELFPPLSEPWEDVDLTLELNSGVSNPQHMLVGNDIRKVIKPTLNAIAESKRSERSSVENERIKVDNELDQLTLECENVEEDVAEIEKKVVALNDQADDLRDAAQQEALVANQEATRLERDLAQARTAALANGMGVKSRLQALQFDYREQMEKVSRLKEETVRAILKNGHEIAMFKEEVSRHLRELREFTESD